MDDTLDPLKRLPGRGDGTQNARQKLKAYYMCILDSRKEIAREGTTGPIMPGRSNMFTLLWTGFLNGVARKGTTGPLMPGRSYMLIVIERIMNMRF